MDSIMKWSIFWIDLQIYKMVHILDKFTDLQNGPYSGQVYKMAHILDRFTKWSIFWTDLQNGPYSWPIYRFTKWSLFLTNLQKAPSSGQNYKNEVISNKRQPQHPESPFLHNPAKELNIFMSKPMLGPLFKPIWINSQNLVLACLNSK